MNDYATTCFKIASTHTEKLLNGKNEAEM